MALPIAFYDNVEMRFGLALKQPPKHLSTVVYTLWFFLPFRSTPVFSAFIAGIPHVLDRNPDWGKELLPLTLQLLLFCPAPEIVNKSRKPNYTLGILETHVRHSWLMTLLIYLYKARH